MAALPPSLLAHFQQLSGKKAKTGTLTSAKPSAGTAKTSLARKPSKGKNKRKNKGVPLTAAQKAKLPIGFQKAILRSRGFNV